MQEEIVKVTSDISVKHVDVIIPVYAGFDETVSAVSTAASTIDRDFVNLVVINDCSPEPEITRWLRENSENLGFELLENEQNLGFVRTVNRGMRLHEDRDVVLLNSDVEVANDWLVRLQETAYSKENVASVTATANNATICSFPVFCEDNKLPFNISVQQVDRSFSKCVPSQTSVEIPTAVGCCMYIRRDALTKLGVFDAETFGRGYGEENDWSQRAIKADLVNLHALNVFVYHKGAVSFAEESDPRKQESLEIINRRYPNYIRDVHQFISNDPAHPWRLKALLKIISELEMPRILAISHGLGGGVKTHILEMVRSLSGLCFLHLEPLSEHIVRLNFLPSVMKGPCLDFQLPEQYDDLLDVLRACRVNHVHFHHTMNLHNRVWKVAADLECEFDYTLHDYWVLNANPTLTDSTGEFIGEGNAVNGAYQSSSKLPKGITLEDWREKHRKLMKDARYLIFPSKDLLHRISRVAPFQDLEQWVVTPHLDHWYITSSKVQWNPQSPLKVAVIGALSKEKGADVLEGVAKELCSEPIEFHLMGYAYRKLDSSVITHGPYPEEQCIERLRSINPDVVWFTARWPETYSYTLSVALKGGFPVVAPNIGAFPERLSGKEKVLIVDRGLNIKELSNLWRKISSDPTVIDNASAPRIESDISYDKGFYNTKYSVGIIPKSPTDKVAVEKIQSLIDQARVRNTALRRSEFVLRVLLRLREFRGVSFLVNLVPLKVQRMVKRRLSRQPIHELTK